MSIFRKFQLTLLLSCTILLFAHSISAQEATPTPTPASNNSQYIQDLANEIADLENKINDLKTQQKTLSSQIAVMDSQIKLTQLRINSTEQQITDLTLDIDTADKKIGNLETSLQKLTGVLIDRIVATYEVGTVQPFHVLLSSNNASNFFTRLNYLKIAQEHDKKLIFDTTQARNDYANQKEIFENKKDEVEELRAQLKDYNNQLDQDKKNKQRVLAETQGNEANYQRLLANARVEYEAIQGIISGRGTEGEVGQVSQGDTIASIIQGSSCNSTGTHLHFTVSRNGATENPFNYLKGIDYTNESGGDPFNPSGSWEWPISGPIQLNQGYGVTWFVNTYHAYSFHNGIDISGSSSSVRAVKGGTLFQGSYSGNGGCRLRYVRVHHSDDGLDTFYLHVNYVR